MDHRNSITNRIEQLRKNFEKNKEGNQDNQEPIIRNRVNFVGRSSVYDRVKFIESQLEKCIIKHISFLKLLKINSIYRRI